uniref:Uncharacterized protein n=1 Tax=Arundo donax TaxID=35708 RepID=A0A0A9HIS5_ARUDO
MTVTAKTAKTVRFIAQNSKSKFDKNRTNQTSVSRAVSPVSRAVFSVNRTSSKTV